MQNGLLITTFGGLSIKRAGAPIGALASRKVEALLVYLACNPRVHRREALAELLWEERTQQQAMSNLRVALTSLRKELDDYVVITRETVAINAGGTEIWLDAAELEKALGRGQIEDALALYQGVFLEGFSLREARGFEDWALAERERLARCLQDALNAQAAEDLRRGAFREGVAHASQLLALDPLREEAHRLKMLLLACSGQRTAALSQYETCKQVLLEELGVEPSPEVQETYDLLAQGERPPGIPEAPGVRERRLEAVGESPYRGLAAFREADAPFFFGREAFTEKLHTAVKTQPVVAVIVGSSGSGKSSAVYAGLLPRLREEDGWLIADFRPGSNPFRSLAGKLMPLLEPELNETDHMLETRRLADALRVGELPLLDVVDRALSKKPTQRLLLIADQFEELYTLCADVETRRALLDMLLKAVAAANGQREPRFVLLLTIRADFMGQALAHRPFADTLQESALIMGPMNRAELRAAIEKPAGLQGAAFEAGLVERLLDDVGEEPGNLPLLEFALTLLWEQQSYGWMTHDGYEAIGRVEGALANYADRVYEGLSQDEQEAARQVFVQLVRPGVGTEDTRRVASRAEVGEGNWGLARRLADKRLVVTGQDAAGNETVEVVHEALIQGWGQLRDWIDEDRAFRTWQERLRANLRQWVESGEDEGALLRGAPLAEAEGWQMERGGELSAEEEEYIQTSLVFRELRQMERERRRRRVIIGLAFGLLVALGLALLAGWQWRIAQDASELAIAGQDAAQAASTLAINERSVAQTAQAEEALQRNIAEANRATSDANAAAYATARSDEEIQRQLAEENEYKAQLQASIGLAALAEGELATGLQDYGVLLALEALQNYPYTWQAELALGKAVNTSHLRHILKHTDEMNIVAWSPDGTRLVTANDDKTAMIWDANSGKQLLKIEHDFPVFLAYWSPDSTQILSFEAVLPSEGKLLPVNMYLWNAATGEKIQTFSSHEKWINRVTWSPAGDRIASASSDLTAKVWDVNSGEELLTLCCHEHGVYSATWSPEGDRIATTSWDGTVIIWDTRTGEKLVTFTEHFYRTYDAAWSPSGDRIATSSRDGMVRVWDPNTGQEQFSLENPCELFLKTSVYWSPDGGRLLTVRCQSKIWDAESGEIILALDPAGHKDRICGASWSQDGDQVLIGEEGGGAKIVDTTTGVVLYTLRGHEGGLIDWSESCVAWSPNEEKVATIGNDGAAMVWDLPKTPTLVGHQNIAVVVDWSRDGERIVTGSIDGILKVWKATTDEEIQTITSELELSTAFWSPSGDLILSGSEAGNIFIWDANSGDMVQSFPGADSLVFQDWSPDGTKVAAVSNDGILHIWDFESGEELLVKDNLGGTVYDVYWSPSGEWLLVSFEQLAYVLDASTGEPVLTISDLPGRRLKSAWSPVEEHFAVGGADGIGRIYNALSGEVVQELAGPIGRIWGITWSPDGKRIATGGNDPYIRIWDAENGMQVLEYPVNDVTYFLDWSPDGTQIAAAFESGKVVIYPIWQTLEELIDYAFDCCVVRELSPDDREKYGLPPLEQDE